MIHPVRRALPDVDNGFGSEEKPKGKNRQWNLIYNININVGGSLAAWRRGWFGLLTTTGVSMNWVCAPFGWINEKILMDRGQKKTTRIRDEFLGAKESKAEKIHWQIITLTHPI